MKKHHALFSVATAAFLLGAAAPHAARAQTAIVVSSCGTAPYTLMIGTPQPLFEDSTGKQCTSASGGGGGGAVTIASGAVASGAYSLGSIVDLGTGATPAAYTANNYLQTLAGHSPALNGDGGVPSHVTNFPATQPVSGTVTASAALATASGTITALDTGTTTHAGQSSVNLVTGTPTANSSVTLALSGLSSVTITVQTSTTFPSGGAFQIETSSDGGTTYFPASAKIGGTSLVSASITGYGVFRVDVTGMTNLRVRATAYTTGTLTLALAGSNSAGLSQIINPIRGVDNSGNNWTIKAASTQSTTADTTLAVQDPWLYAAATAPNLCQAASTAPTYSAGTQNQSCDLSGGLRVNASGAGVGLNTGNNIVGYENPSVPASYTATGASAPNRNALSSGCAVIKASAGNLYWISVTSTAAQGATTDTVEIFNAATAPSNGATPTLTLASIQANQTVSYPLPPGGFNFSSGLVTCLSTGGATLTKDTTGTFSESDAHE